MIAIDEVRQALANGDQKGGGLDLALVTSLYRTPARALLLLPKLRGTRGSRRDSDKTQERSSKLR